MLSEPLHDMVPLATGPAVGELSTAEAQLTFGSSGVAIATLVVEVGHDSRR
jgi:hypothetical protein